jgi:ABC-type transport system involved in multi-copper enzyme maturation permease subunit
MWKPAEPVAWLSPFRYYRPFDLVMGNPLPSKNLVVLSAIAVVAFVGAYVLFSRRDIAH